VTEQRILYTALDTYVRHFTVVVVPPDAVAHIDADLGVMHRGRPVARRSVIPRETSVVSGTLPAGSSSDQGFSLPWRVPVA
jgi:hypothetical protein